MTRRIIALACSLSLAAGLTAVGTTAASATPTTPAAPEAPTAECTQYATRPDPVTQQPTVVCVRWSQPPGHPSDGNDDDDANDSDNGDGDGPECWWELYPIPAGVVPDRPAGVSDQAVMYWELCLNSFGNTYVGPGAAQWFEPDAAPTPSPAQVATQVRVEVAASLRDPVIATDPPATEPSILHVPTFVAVTNWQGPVTVDGCDPSGAVCVAITATPTLRFDPGEPGARAIPCEGGGTRFDRTGPAPDVQAEGACAHAYAQRTGVDDRPEAWTASATIDWDVQWHEQGGGANGVFADISATQTFDRQVDELRTVVVGTS
jgi:hypothetical protein